jgi:hypothetical protein
MPGEIWSTRAKPVRLKGVASMENDTPCLVLLLDLEGEVLLYEGVKYRKILVAPISTNIEMATEWDFVIKQEESPLGYPFMIEMWNKVTMLAENLQKGLAKFDESFFEHILRLSQAETEGLFDESRFGPEFFRNNVGEGKAEMGNEIYHFQRREMEEVEYLLQPVKALSELANRENVNKEIILDKLKARIGTSSDVDRNEIIPNQFEEKTFNWLS